MVAIASRARTLSTLVAAGATLIAALALTPEQAGPRAGCPTPTREHADDGMALAASWQRHDAGAHVVVAINAPDRGPVRPALSVAIAIDRSKSMSGEPIEHAKAAAARLVSQLGPGDAFAVIAYSDDHTTVVPMLPATAVHKELALRAIAELAVDNGTCTSCGLARAGEWLGRTPVEQGVRRIVLISDGYANLGLRDRDDLVQLAAETAARGTSITAVGVGLDFDEQTMMRIAEVGRGNYYYVKDTGRLDAAFDREVAGLAETVATDVRLTLGDAISIPIADLGAGETRKVVLRVAGAAPACGLVARLSWRRALDGAGRGAVAVAGPAEADLDAIEPALAAEALERAAELHERRGPAAARQHLEDHAAALAARPAPDSFHAIRRNVIRVQLGEAAAAFAAAAGGGDAAGALKRARSQARALAR